MENLKEIAQEKVSGCIGKPNYAEVKIAFKQDPDIEVVTNIKIGSEGNSVSVDNIFHYVRTYDDFLNLLAEDNQHDFIIKEIYTFFS